MIPALAAETPYKFHSNVELAAALTALADSLTNRARSEADAERARILWNDRDLCREAAKRLQP